MEEWSVIQSNNNYSVSTYGNVMNIKTKKILKPILCKNGYLMVNLNPIKYIHRLVAECFINSNLEGLDIDHINRIRTDNRLDNLRLATRAENNYNTTKRQNTTSKYKGVCWCSTKKRWRCSIKIDKKQTNKYFINEDDAGLYYNELCVKNNIAYAYFNKVEK